ncbi:MAG: TIGR04282 family arsenosugar biosynthesis glycosyltransferase [Ktedonobacteraceae bacterium]|nr:TIGR04282 family arsenosugar biosynthesis glycosyltransferase [Ktedonobacteraceae bacterium]
MPDTALIIMARYPEAGKTKTRLARTLGAQATADLYRAFLTDLARRFAGQPYALHWAYTPAGVAYHQFVASLAPEHAQAMTCFPQRGDDFNSRLLAAFQWTATQGFARTVLIGSDSPHIPPALVESAAAALDEVDVVLGPADDGGYYLLAIRKPYDVFSGIPMSTEVVARMTIEAALRQGLTVRLLSHLFDVDEWPDLERLAELLQQDSTLAPATAAYLAHLAQIRSFA